MADPLADLNTSGNALSVWLVRDDRSDLVEIAAALSAKGMTIDRLDYVLLDEARLSELGIRAERTHGDTPDDEANRKHVDLVELSAQKLVALARAILDKGQPGRIPQKEIARSVARAVLRGRIDRARLSDGVRAKIEGE